MKPGPAIEQRLGQGAGVFLGRLGVGEHAIGLKIAKARVGRAHVGCKTGLGPAEFGGSSPQGRIEVVGDVKPSVHPTTQTPRLKVAQDPIGRGVGQNRSQCRNLSKGSGSEGVRGVAHRPSGAGVQNRLDSQPIMG